MARNYTFRVTGNNSDEREVDDSYLSAFVRGVDWISDRPTSGTLKIEFKDWDGQWYPLRGGNIDLSAAGKQPSPFIEGECLRSLRVTMSGVAVDAELELVIYTDSRASGIIDNTIYSSNDEYARLKVSSESSVDTATKVGIMHAVSFSLDIANGESVSLYGQYPGETFVRFVNADSLTVIHARESSGDLSALYSSASLNMSKESQYAAHFELLNNPAYSDVRLTGDSPLNVGILSDDYSSIILQNNTGSDVITSVSIGLQSSGNFVFPFGLTTSTLLEPGTEVSIYG